MSLTGGREVMADGLAWLFVDFTRGDAGDLDYDAGWSTRDTPERVSVGA